MERKDYCCPITKLIYNEPVLAEDGHIYENKAIMHWLRDNRISPITGDYMGKTVKSVNEFRKLVDKYLDLHPDEYMNQFMIKKPYYLFKEEFRQKLVSNEFNELTSYINIYINDYINDLNTNMTIIEYLANKCKNNDVIKTIIKNSVDYDIEDASGYKVINYIMKYNTVELVYFLFELEINKDYIDITGKNIMHYGALYYMDNPELLKFLFVNKIDAEHVDKNGNRPIHYLIYKTSNINSIKVFYDNKANINVPNRDGWYPIHLMFKNSNNIQCIKYILDLDIDINVNIKSLVDDELICEKLIFDNEKLEKQQKQEVLYYYLKRVVNRRVIDNFIS